MKLLGSDSMYNFKRLITKYSKGIVTIIEETEGYYDIEQGGKWIPGETIETIISPAAIVPLNKDDLRFDDGGTYNNDDRKVYCYKEMKKGTIVKHEHSKGSVKEYKVLQDANYGDFDTNGDGLFIYYLKLVGGND